MPWTPPPRAPWVEKLVSVGAGLGDDGRSLVPLTPEAVLSAAAGATGLDDFGDDWFRDPLDVLCDSLEGEAMLHLAGRLRCGAELQTLTQNRLRLVDLWKQEPAIAGEEIHRPIFVTGLGRSGTTLLHELLALDGANRVPLLWELLYSVPPPDSRSYAEDPRIGLADAEITLMDEMVPAFTAMHENRGFLPTECIFSFAHQFSSDMFIGLYNVPSYAIWRSGIDQAPIYEWHRRMLQTLQWHHRGERWVLKAPSHLSSLALVFAAYPDARVVVTHRDPLRVVGSLADMMATLHWMHSDLASYDTLVEFLSMGLEFQMDQVSADRDAGDLPDSQITDVLYRDLVADPVAAVARLYDDWRVPFTSEFEAKLRSYVDDRHANRSGGHDYSFEDTGLSLGEHRERVAAYQSRFGVPSEV